MAKKTREPKTPDPASFAFGVLQHVIEATGDKLLLAHVPVQYRRHDGHEHEDEDGGEWTGLGEGCDRDIPSTKENRRVQQATVKDKAK